MQQSVRIAPSILAADFARLGDEVRAIEQAGADYVHIDVMDGHFVPNLSIGVPVMASLRKRFPDAYFDVHLMVTNPERFVRPFADAGADHLINDSEDLRARHRHNAVCNTIGRLLANGAVPIVNENDTVSATEIKFGDNDTLSALVASVVHADMLFILSNIPGLIDIQGTGEVVPVVDTITDEIEAMAHGTKQETSVGGMVSKLSAAKIAQRAGCGVIIGSGGDSTLFKKLLNGESVGTYFEPSEVPVKSHKRWIAIQDHTHGAVNVDAGAVDAVLNRGKSLLQTGITSCEGNFEGGDVVQICAPSGDVIAHGVIDFDMELINDDSPVLEARVVVHRNNLVLL